MDFGVSFEFFPPKTMEGSQKLLQAAVQLATATPSFFSVTFGAGGSTRHGTIEIIQALQNTLTIPMAPHLSCIGFNREDLVGIIHQYQSMGLKRIVALRGDLPSGMGACGAFKFAHELVALIRETTGHYFHIEVAAYPECHPQAKNVRQDLLNLKQKFQAGANSAITQYFFNSDAYYYFLDECAKQQITLPIIPGIMPILQFNKLIRFSELCGAEIPRWLYKRLEAYGDDIESIKAFGVEAVTSLCQQLIAAGAPGLHFYTLNQTESCLQIVRNLNIPLVTAAKKSGSYV